MSANIITIFFRFIIKTIQKYDNYQKIELIDQFNLLSFTITNELLTNFVRITNDYSTVHLKRINYYDLKYDAT